MPVAESLETVLERRATALRFHLPAALAGEVTGVHQARVASRRLRETLPLLLAAGLDGAVERARRAVRRVTRALGPVRELDVALGLLTTHLDAHPEEVVEGLVVRAWLERLRADARDAMLEALDARQVDRLSARLTALEGHAWTDAARPGPAPARAALADRLQVRGTALSAEVAHTGMLYAPEPLHAVRIAAKKLRYAAELAGDLGLGVTAALVRTLKRQQDLLGRIHDLEVLASLADRACAEAPRRVHAARLVGDWHRECRELHARYLRARPALLSAAAAAGRLGRRLAQPPRARRARSAGASRPGRRARGG